MASKSRRRTRCGHRDSTMILIGYRHGLRASELCDLMWHQVELATGRLHVRRVKRGSPRFIPSKAMKYAVCAVFSASMDHQRTCSAPSAAAR